jgi:2-polyprenyl-3-methyl-5-hydroxy-6-metoxy-1,4-benzoquinol methylase
LQLNEQKKVLDLGCGFGLFSMFLASEFKDLEVIGLDHDTERLRAAQAASSHFKNLTLAQGDLLRSPLESHNFDSIFAIDVMHYFSYETQENIIKNLKAHLTGGNGTLTIREIAQDRNLAYFMNFTYEKLASTFGFTKSQNKGELFLRSRKGWEEFFQKLDFDVQSLRCGSLIFNDYLFIARLKPLQNHHVDIPARRHVSANLMV